MWSFPDVTAFTELTIDNDFHCTTMLTAPPQCQAHTAEIWNVSPLLLPSIYWSPVIFPSFPILSSSVLICYLLSLICFLFSPLPSFSLLLSPLLLSLSPVSCLFSFFFSSLRRWVKQQQSKSPRQSSALVSQWNTQFYLNHGQWYWFYTFNTKHNVDVHATEVYFLQSSMRFPAGISSKPTMWLTWGNGWLHSTRPARSLWVQHTHAQQVSLSNILLLLPLDRFSTASMCVLAGNVSFNKFRCLLYSWCSSCNRWIWNSFCQSLVCSLCAWHKWIIINKGMNEAAVCGNVTVTSLVWAGTNVKMFPTDPQAPPLPASGKWGNCKYAGAITHTPLWWRCQSTVVNVMNTPHTFVWFSCV